jgi:hypothetical protein
MLNGEMPASNVARARTSYYRAKPVLLARGLVVFEGSGPGACYSLAHERVGTMDPDQSHEEVPGTSGLVELLEQVVPATTRPTTVLLTRREALPW